MIHVFSDPTFEAEKNKIAIGVAGLLLGLVFVLGGAVFYKRNTTSEKHDKRDLLNVSICNLSNYISTFKE